MNEQEFNGYCAEVMGYEIEHDSIGALRRIDGFLERYNPDEDLNQLAEVVEKLLILPCVDESGTRERFYRDIAVAGDGLCSFKKSFRDFVWSTKGE